MLNTFKATLAAVAIMALSAVPAAAGTEEELMSNYMDLYVAPWVADPAIIAAIQAQNAAHAGLTDADIDTMDKAWRAEADAGTGATIDPVLTNAVSELLRGHLAEADGTITELFIMDNRGLNVAVSAPTSDYWQGDEEKFTETYAKGANARHISEIESDVSTGKFQAQVSMTIVDPATGMPIGAITAGFAADSLL